ncbi:MAG: 2-dehydropantoate 2-reductase [Colwellia polaris]|jgi:2-dehydropantoate 2-reductase|uniref:ketopantoate reductase family protein n=1 Tax=Colwellia polaris TaxID=326537 RepID=UPI000A1773F6|nr:2-dehydropantoate 2-reductase [Colwellia polaris]|tara:strand:+ start:9364 stop:10350 length:987 start_codon:yes stop_codon:yes gene_type:complete
MHFVIVGCGAVGGYFGGRLAQHGEKVTFIARGKQLQAMQKTGLTIKSIEGDVHLDNLNVVNAENLTLNSLSSPADVIFLCVKSYHLAESLAQITPLITENTKIIPLLNGVNAAEIMHEYGVAKENIIGGLAKIIAEKSAEGVINHTGAKPHITLGSFSASTSKRADEKTQPQKATLVMDETAQLSEIAKRLTLAGISVGVTSDIELALWRKFILVAAWGTLASARKLNLGEIRAQSHIAFLLERIVNEYGDIARKSGVGLGDKHIKETLSFLSRLPDSSETSMQRDLAAGSNSEFDVLIAYPVKLVEKLNLSAPVLMQCYERITKSLP